MILDTPVRSLRLVLGEAHTTRACDIVACYGQQSPAGTFVTALSQTASTGTTPVTLVAAPLIGSQNLIQEVRLHNADTVTHTVVLQLLDNATTRTVYSGTVLAGADWVYTPGAGSNTTSVTVPVASATTPLMDGVGAPGVSTAWSRGDHVHPTDTTLAPLASPTFTGAPTAPTATALTSTTQVATTAFTTSAVGVETSRATTAEALLAPLAAWAWIFGTGADGNVTISSGTTTLTRDMHYADLTINGTGVLAPAGFRVFVRDTLDLSAAPSGAIVRSGFAGNAAAGVTGGVSQGNAAAYGMGYGAPIPNAVGGASGNSTNGVTPTVGFAPTNYGAGGDSGAGGVGGQGASSVPRSAGAIATVPGRAPFVTPATTLVMTYNTSTSFQGVTHVMGGACGSAGSPGTGDGTNSGGGSGGAGGGGHVLAIWARIIARGANSNTSIVQARGGAGGGGGTPPSGNCGGGAGSGGGGGGFVYVVTGGVTGSSIAGALDASGGVGGAGGNGIGTGLGGGGGAGGNGGMVVLINLGAATTTVNSYNTAGTAGSTTATITGAAGGAGGNGLAAL